MKKTNYYFLLFSALLVLCSGINKPVRIFMVGDSTMANKPAKAFPENGWGMALAEMVNDDAIVENHAVNGRSTKSFINEGRWDSVYNKITAGDYVIIQFGHNDAKIKDSTRYTIPQTTYKENLRKYITDTRNKGGNPVLCTSIVRRHFDKNGKLVDTHGDYPKVMRELATEMNVPLVDLQKLTEKKINKLGPEKSKELFMIFGAGVHSTFPEGKADSTHLTVNGAKMVAKLFVNQAKKQKLAISKFFK